MEKLANYQYRGARAMVILHEQYLRDFLDVWKKAKAFGLVLPETDHSAYVSLETLLKHVLECARHYLMWICEKLDLPDPAIRPEPLPDVIETEVESYLEHLLQQWQTPLAGIVEERFDAPEYRSRWDMLYSISSMLEHAVMHPILHRFQLEELLKEQEV